jgi:hypothetical protein
MRSCSAVLSFRETGQRRLISTHNASCFAGPWQDVPGGFLSGGHHARRRRHARAHRGAHHAAGAVANVRRWLCSAFASARMPDDGLLPRRRCARSELERCGLGGCVHKYGDGDRAAALAAVRARGGVLLTSYGMVLHNSTAVRILLRVCLERCRLVSDAWACARSWARRAAPTPTPQTTVLRSTPPTTPPRTTRTRRRLRAAPPACGASLRSSL